MRQYSELYTINRGLCYDIQKLRRRHHKSSECGKGLSAVLIQQLQCLFIYICQLQQSHVSESTDMLYVIVTHFAVRCRCHIHVNVILYMYYVVLT